MNLDSLDKQILMLLQHDCSLKTKEVAAHIGLSITPTYDRIKRLEKNGVIEKYVAIVNQKTVDKSVTVICHITLQKHEQSLLTKFENDIKDVKEIVACFHIAGNYDYILKVIVPNLDAYSDFIKNTIATIKNVSNVHSSFVMSAIKNETAISL
jgi:Lrp/AsnC family transcriptional regulator, leucine-responsive regulatory protein